MNKDSVKNFDKENVMVVDGNEAAAYVAYAFSEVAAIYPITPSSPMAEKTDEWSANGRKNLYTQPVTLVEMQSEAGAIGAVHGALEAGSLATSFTSSQGLMLMIPVLHRISGTRQPAVLHVASRTVGTHAMSIFGDHSDVMNCRQTGFAMLSTGSVQEVMDLAGVAHLSAVKARIPFMHFFDGFRTSHEIQKIRAIPYEKFGEILDWQAVRNFRESALNPYHPSLRNTVQNPDVYFQFREANNRFYDGLPEIVEEYMGEINKITGEDYHIFNYYGAPDAERVIIAMGSVSGAIRETVEYINSAIDAGEMDASFGKVGYVQVHLFNPFSKEHLLKALPKTVKRIAVMDRCKEMGAAGEPLYLAVCSAFTNDRNAPYIIGGRYGLSSKDTTPAMIKAVFDHIDSDDGFNGFSVGINDDVTHLSIPVGKTLPIHAKFNANEDAANSKNADANAGANTNAHANANANANASTNANANANNNANASTSAGTNANKLVECKFWGLGSDGTVGANKNSIKIIGENTDMYAQAYFEYDTKKSFGITRSHLRFGDQPIKGSYLVSDADFIACHNQTFLDKYEIVGELKQGGTLLLNTSWSGEELEENLPVHVKRELAEKEAKLYTIDANAIANELGLGDHASMVLQAAFFALAGIIPMEEAIELMKKAAEKSFGKKGDAVVNMNLAAIDRGATGVTEVEVPKSWKDEIANSDSAEAYSDNAAGNANRAENENTQHSKDCTNTSADEPDFIKKILRPINALKGDNLPVSTFIGYEDGTMPLGTTAYEKRGIATRIPVWDGETCAQCNRCSFVCPHAVIRPYLLNEEELGNAPENFVAVPAKGIKATKDAEHDGDSSNEKLYFSIQVSDMDCTGCGSCVASCPLSGKALKMEPVTEKLTLTPEWEYALTISDKDVFDHETVKGSQFRQPLCEFSGACAGCGETPYAKLLTQLYGDRMYWANATGCSQAWGAAMPSIPYTVSKEGRGPAWSNSLFENNAEFCLGMYLSVKQQRSKTRAWIEELKELQPEFTEVIDGWLATYNDVSASMPASNKFQVMLEEAELTGRAAELKMLILRHPEHLAKQPVWMYGGDGWAYDIGFGGLDHVIAMGEDINVLVVDTEVYSNTGGQSSKATPLGAVAQFQAAGKKSGKKDLGKMMMAYGNCYVASVAMGADMNQLMKAITEAEAFPGPSLIIAYAPCINHGIKAGMDQAQAEMKRAVESGYWPLYRFNPANKEHPFTLDSKEPTMGYQEFLEGEVRYASLHQTFPENAKTLFAQAEKEAKDRYESYKKLSEQ